MTARVAAPVVLGAALLGFWQFLVSVVGISDYLLPSPASVLAQLREFAPAIAEATKVTGLNAFAGLVAGTAAGVALALLASGSRAVDGMGAPVVSALAVVPIVALAPVLNSMYGADSQLGRQVVAALAAFVPVYVNTLRGLRQTQPVHRDLMRSYAASPWQRARTVTLPTAVPFVFTGVRVASSLAVISALVAEYFGGPRGGLGSQISTSAASSAYPRAWAYVTAAIALGLLFYAAALALEKAVTKGRA